jgi:hypothetical protein
MVTRCAAQQLKMHGDFVRAIAERIGDEPFTAGSLATAGISIPKGIAMTRFHNAGIFNRAGGLPHEQRLWRLSPEIVAYYGAHGASA